LLVSYYGNIFWSFLDHLQATFIRGTISTYYVLWDPILLTKCEQKQEYKNFVRVKILLVSTQYTVDPRLLNGLILKLETRTKNSRKIRFETWIKIRKSNYERGIAQHRAAHATVRQQIRTRLVECCWSVCTSARPVLA